MQEDVNKIEAVLFITGRFLSLEDIGKFTGLASAGYVKDAMNTLIKRYSANEGALELTQQGDKFKLGLKKQYLHLSESLLTDAELDRPTQETLAVIAYKNPALQSEIIRIRGNTAYDHIKILKELDFITTEPSGKTYIIKLTNKFFDYFDIVENQLRSKLHSKVENTGDANAENKEQAEGN
jgi:segregation and condensation protein B